MIQTMRTAAMLAVVLAAWIAPACGQSGPAADADRSQAAVEEREDRVFYLDAARLAWRYIEENTDSTTGLVRATPQYANATTWDIASGMAAVYSAHRLGLIEDEEYRARLGRMLATLEAIPLYDNAAFHKAYRVADGSMIDTAGTPSRTGYAWSATDLGRLLVWLGIIARNDRAFAAQAERIARRMAYDRILSDDGYLQGEDRHREVPTFLEGRVGYEQYSAAGFALWGHRAGRALDPRINGQPMRVMGQTILRDGRGLDRLLSEPFVMMGLELGLEGSMQELARGVLGVQRARWEATDTVTIASEDAVGVPPWYFYYYCVYCNGKPFIVDVHRPGLELDEPRWVSTKNAFGWNAIMQDDYTRLALRTVQPARTPEGWNSGVFEGTTRPTGTVDVNTAAVILESALYVELGGPLIEG